jgi:hypothetical protein
MSATPSGEERKVQFLGGASVDGAPVAYVVVLAAVVTVLSFIPFSVQVFAGGSFPMSQGIFPLVGWILGPIAGAVASGVGSIIGVFLAPHTAGAWYSAVPSYIFASFAAGSMVLGGKRRGWWVGVTAIAILGFIAFFGRAILINKVSPGPAIVGSLTQISGLVLYVLPLRTVCARWINSKNYALVALGLFVGTWICAALYRLVGNAISYQVSNFPEAVFLVLAPIIPMENLFRSLLGTVIGTGLIAGLRAIGVVKPEHAIY